MTEVHAFIKLMYALSQLHIVILLSDIYDLFVLFHSILSWNSFLVVEFFKLKKNQNIIYVRVLLIKDKKYWNVLYFYAIDQVNKFCKICLSACL